LTAAAWEDNFLLNKTFAVQQLFVRFEVLYGKNLFQKENFRDWSDSFIHPKHVFPSRMSGGCSTLRCRNGFYQPLIVLLASH